MQLPMLKKKYLKFENYKQQTIEDMFEPSQLEGMLELKAYQMASCLAINEGGKFGWWGWGGGLREFGGNGVGWAWGFRERVNKGWGGLQY